MRIRLSSVHGLSMMLLTGLILGTNIPVAPSSGSLRGQAVHGLSPSSSGLLRAPLRTESAQVQNKSQLALTACPMAHCDQQMSDDEAISIPTSTVSGAWVFTATGTTPARSLGCSLGVTSTLCVETSITGSLAYDRPYMYALDIATGVPLWNSAHYLNGTVKYGVPLIDAAGNNYVSDDNVLASFDGGGHLRWRVPNPAHAAMYSFNMTSDGHLVGQGRRGPLLVVDPISGTVTGSLLLTDTIDGDTGTFITLNTVSVTGNRVYSVTQFCSQLMPCVSGQLTFSVGRLYAVDIVNGVPRMAWHWDFAGPSGASPLTIAGTPSPVIYFDGAGLVPGDPDHPWLFAVQDQGSSPQLLWGVDLEDSFGTTYTFGIQASPTRDPRGGVWDWVTGDSRLFRLDQSSGDVLQTIDISNTPGLSGYIPTSAMSIAINGGRPIMILGTATKDGTRPPVLVAIDLTSGQILWQVLWQKVFGTGIQQYNSQFPIATLRSGTYLIATRSDQPVFGLQLH